MKSNKLREGFDTLQNISRLKGLFVGNGLDCFIFITLALFCHVTEIKVHVLSFVLVKRQAAN